MIGFWNLVENYDATIAKTTPERLRAIDLPLLELCTGGKRVLGIGCGTARFRKPVEKAGCQYVGIDPSLKLLQEGAARGESNLVRGAGEYLPFPDGCFDVVIGGYWAFLFIQLDKLYPECARVLRPGGTMAFTLLNKWASSLNSFAVNVRRKRFHTTKHHYETFNELDSPVREIRRLARFGFTVELILSTRNVPLLRSRRPFSNYFGWQGYWRGVPGALVGYDVIFICKRQT